MVSDKPMIKVFISQPMNGKTEKDILDERLAIKQLILDIYGKAFSVMFIDSYNQEEGLSRIEMLGNSIKKMADANLVVFAPDYYRAHGCSVERSVAEHYNIPVRYIYVKNNDPTCISSVYNSMFSEDICVSEWRWL